MRISSWLILMLSLCFLISVLVAVDPDTLNQVGMALVFGAFFSFFLSLGLLLLTGLSVRWLGFERTLLYQGAALRQSGLVALFLTGIVVAQYYRMFVWWGVLLGFAFILLIELTWRRSMSRRS